MKSILRIIMVSVFTLSSIATYISPALAQGAPGIKKGTTYVCNCQPDEVIHPDDNPMIMKCPMYDPSTGKQVGWYTLDLNDFPNGTATYELFGGATYTTSVVFDQNGELDKEAGDMTLEWALGIAQELDGSSVILKASRHELVGNGPFKSVLCRCDIRATLGAFGPEALNGCNFCVCIFYNN